MSGFRATTGNYAPGHYHAADACRSRFQSLAQQLTQYINVGNVAAALHVLDNCAERREEYSVSRFGVANNAHNEPVRLIRNLYAFIEGNPLPRPVTITFVDGAPRDKQFQIWHEGIPYVAIFSRLIMDGQGNRYPSLLGGRRRKSTRKHRKIKHRKTRRHH